MMAFVFVLAKPSPTFEQYCLLNLAKWFWSTLCSRWYPLHAGIVIKANINNELFPEQIDHN